VAVAWLAGCTEGPQKPPPLTTASIEVMESLGASVDPKGYVITPPLTAHVCVTCPECADDAKLQVTFLGRPGMPVGRDTEPPACGPGTIDLWADASGALIGDAVVEVSDGNSSISATFSADAFAPRTLTYPGPGNLELCLGAPVTLDWSPASDLPATPITDDTARVFFLAPIRCMECGPMGFGAPLTADASGIHFVVPSSGTGGQGAGTLTAILPVADAEPALRCDGGVACRVRPFQIARMTAAPAHTCPP